MSLMLLMAMATFPIKVAIIDSGVDLNDNRIKDTLCAEGHKDLTNTGMWDSIGHGTHIAGIIAANTTPLKHCIIIIKAFDKDGVSPREGMLFKGIQHAIKEGAKYINISAGGPGALEYERQVIYSNPNTTFIVAAGNNSADIEKVPYYPASYDLPNMIVVGSLNTSGKKSKFSNYGKAIDAWEQGENVFSIVPNGWAYLSGTSQATAVHTAKILTGRK